MTGVQSLYFRKPFSSQTTMPNTFITGVVFQFFFLCFFHVFLSFFFFKYIYIYTHIIECVNCYKKKTKKWMHSIDRPPHFFFPPIRPPIIYWWALLIRAPKPCAYKRRRNRGSIPATPTCFPSKFPRVLDPVGAQQQFRNTTITDGLFI